MKLPRDISGSELIKLLKEYGYAPTRQTGSHIRITTELNGTHHVTIPNHSPIKVGTLSSIMSEVANHLGKTKDQLMFELFG